MTTKTAGTLVTITVGVLIAGAVLTAKKKSDQDNYRTYWGISLFGIGGAALADLIPDVVGPYVLLVLIAYAAKSGVIGKAVQTGKTATVQPAPTK